jgi:MATE family multidrug resistance protein
MVLNVALSLVLIFGLAGAPRMGVAGAALASSVATAVAFAALYGCFELCVGMPAGAGERSRLRLGELVRLLRFGLPAGINWFIEFAAFVFFVNVIVADLGTSVLAAMMAAMQINSISFMPAFGVASAGAIFVGRAIGAGRHDDVGHTVKSSALLAGIWEGLTGLVNLAVPALLLAPFVKAESVAFMAAGVVVLRLSAAWQLFDAVAMVLAEALRAAGDTAFTSIARGVIAWGVFVPGAWLTVRLWGGGAVGATLWLVAYLALLAAVLSWRFRTGRWRSIELVEPAAVDAPVTAAPARST